MSARASLRLKHSPFDLATAIVCLPATFAREAANLHADANQFKEAFIKAQQENEKLFKEDA